MGILGAVKRAFVKENEGDREARLYQEQQQKRQETIKYFADQKHRAALAREEALYRQRRELENLRAKASRKFTRKEARIHREDELNRLRSNLQGERSIARHRPRDNGDLFGGVLGGVDGDLLGGLDSGDLFGGIVGGGRNSRRRGGGDILDGIL